MTAADQIQDIAAAVAHYGCQVQTITPLHPARHLGGRRVSFRVDIESAGVIKARRMDCADAARRQQEFRADLPPAFVPVLGRVGAILLERWIDGVPLNQLPPSAPQIRTAGEVLAALHTRPGVEAAAPMADGGIAELRRHTQANLAALAAAGAIEAGVVDDLCAMLEQAEPDDGPPCLIHTDFCSENMVVDAAGRLFVVDNEHFRFGPPGADLARSWYRWGWYDGADASAHWQAFREAYRAAGGRADAFEHEQFWRITAVVFSARLRVSLGDPDAAVPLTCLRDMARSFVGHQTG